MINLKCYLFSTPPWPYWAVHSHTITQSAHCFSANCHCCIVPVDDTGTLRCTCSSHRKSPLLLWLGCPREGGRLPWSSSRPPPSRHSPCLQPWVHSSRSAHLVARVPTAGGGQGGGVRVHWCIASY